MSMRKLATEERPPIGSVSLGQRALHEEDAIKYAPFGANCYGVVPHETEYSRNEKSVVVAYYKMPE